MKRQPFIYKTSRSVLDQKQEEVQAQDWVLSNHLKWKVSQKQINSIKNQNTPYSMQGHKVAKKK